MKIKPQITSSLFLNLSAFGDSALIGAFWVLLLASCSGTRHLPESEKLYTGAEIKLESAEKLNAGPIKAAAKNAVRPLPNPTFLGMRPKLWMYNAAGQTPKTKLEKWLQKKGEAPILLSSIKPDATSAIIDATLFNLGIFKSVTKPQIIENKRTAKIIYTSKVHKPYRITDLKYAISDDSLSLLIQTEKENSLIQPGQDYKLDLLRNERLRIDGFLKNKGYFFFNPDYLLFRADTSDADKTVSFRLTLKDSIPKKALTVYRINKVNINQNYSLNEQPASAVRDSSAAGNVVSFGQEESVKPRVLARSVYLHKNDVFSRQKHLMTLNRLMSMGNFKLVQINFAESPNSEPGWLDADIRMTPLPKRTFRAELDLVSKSNNYSGPKLNLSILNRNTFGGAELLKLDLAGSFETQLSGSKKNQYSYSYNPQLELTFPRFLAPFPIRQSNSNYIPKTSISLSANFQKRVDYFDMSTFRLMYGFKWRENIRKEHKLNPIDISFTNVRNQSAAFMALLDANPFLKKSYEEQFVAGASYSFVYNEQMLTEKKLQSYFQLDAELAGNAFSLAKIIGGNKISSDHPEKVMGAVYSQYAKLSIDARSYLTFKDKNKLAMRLFAGVADPFGNSSIMPYSRQFFAGGPNSIRAFQINSLGPGTYFQDTSESTFLHLGGDVKLEANAEYRFNIYSYFKGALFVDTGNVWLLKSNPANTGNPFFFSSFMNEMAVGTGLGLRIDVSFFILRFDLAMPLRKPWLDDRHRWVTNQIDFGSAAWRKDNLLLNVAIGYPF